MPEGTKRYQKGKLYQIDISELQPDPDQPRKYFDEEALSELKASIAKHGVLQPILARKSKEGGLLVVSGERRYQASIQAGLTTVPVLITDGDPVELSIVENLLRENLTAVEEAEAIDRLRSQHDYQLADLSAILGKAQSTLSEILSINKLPAEVKDDCRNDPKAARYILTEIAKQKNSDKMISLYQKYKESGLTRGEIRAKEKVASSKPPMADVSFLATFLKKLDGLSVEKLDQDQLTQVAEDLARVQSAAQSKLEELKPPPAGA